MSTLEASDTLDLATYISTFRKYPMLKKQVEFDRVFVQYKRGATEGERLAARDQLVYGHIRFIVSVALFYVGRGFPLLDLVQEGVLTMVTKMDKYEPGKANFRTYMRWWMRQGMTRAIHDSSEKTQYRLPVHVHETRMAVSKALRQFHEANGRVPDHYETFQWLQRHGGQNAQAISLKKVIETRRALVEGAVSLDAEVSLDGGRVFEEVIEDSRAKTETVVEARRMLSVYREAYQRIETELEALGPRKAMVIRLRFGMGDFEEHTLEEVGQRYELTRERVRQIEAKSLEQLSEKLGISGEEIVGILESIEALESLSAAT